MKVRETDRQTDSQTECHYHHPHLTSSQSQSHSSIYTYYLSSLSLSFSTYYLSSLSLSIFLSAATAESHRLLERDRRIRDATVAQVHALQLQKEDDDALLLCTDGLVLEEQEHDQPVNPRIQDLITR